MHKSNKPMWTIKQLQDKLYEDLSSCNTTHEVIMVKAIGGKEIKEKASAWAKVRKLTPCEIAIAEKYGYRDTCGTK